MGDIQAKMLLGKEVASSLETTYKLEVDRLLNNGIVPGLAVILIGSNAASKVYVRSKARYFEKMKCYSETFTFDDNLNEVDILNLISKLNVNNKFHGILVQLPIPRHIDESKILKAINPKKDVDGFHPMNFGKLFQGQPVFVPCTPNGIMKMIDYYGFTMEGKNVVILGRSNIVGKPMFALLSQKFKNGNATVTLCHTGTPDMTIYTKNADVIIVAVGQPKLLKKDMVKDGVILIDVGINRVDDNSEKGYRLVGDIDFESVKSVAKAITPVPGGVGPMTITMLFINTIQSAMMTLDA